MKRPRWRLREATAASTEPALQRGGAGSGGQTQDADGDYDNDGAMTDCPGCTNGVMADGTVCPTCKGAGKLAKARESEREQQLMGLVAAMTERLREAKPEDLVSTFAPFGSQAAGSYEVVLIREGKGNSEDGRWYTGDAVRELVSSGVCEGMQAYSNHPTLDEEEFLPERSIRDLVGSYREVRLAESDSGMAEARATFVPIKGDGYEWITTLAENAVANSGSKPLVGISLYGAAAGEDRTRPDGSFGAMADLVRPTSGDVVTNAGAGGQFVKRLMESARAMRRANHQPPKESNNMQLSKLMTKIKESATRLREADTDEKRTAALDELDTLAKATVEHDTNDIKVDDLTVETLKESEPLWACVRESFKPEIEAAGKASGNADTAAKDAEIARLNGELGETQTKLQESERKNQRTDVMFAGANVLREAKVPDEEHEFFFSKFREAGATDADAMKEIVRIQQEHDERREQRMRESLGLGSIEGNPGNTGGGSGLIDLSADGVPKVEPADKTAAGAAA